jgi:GTP:adenosylcobinamide-phosphate guanylyltransferase
LSGTQTGARDARFTALVLAGERGEGDPVAHAAGVDHKCWARVGGEPMLVRVVDALRASRAVGRIALSIDPAAFGQAPPALADEHSAGRLETLATAETPCLSILAAAEVLGQPYPLLITTADHALLTPEMVDHFCAAAEVAGADVAAGLASEGVILERYPDSRRTYLRFRDGRRSGANLFAILSEAGLQAVTFWRRVETQRKRPWRLARAFGPRALLGYLFGRYTLDGAMREASRVLGVRATAVDLPFAEAAIDVDKPGDLTLAEGILRDREGGHVHSCPSV